MSKVLRAPRRIARESDEEHWIPLSDLMTTLMFVFLLIALAYMVQTHQQSTQTVQLVDEYQLRHRSLYEALVREFSPDLRKWDAELTPDLTIRFADRAVLFETGSARLRPQFKQTLREFFPRYLRVLTDAGYRTSVRELHIDGTASTPAGASALDPGSGYLSNMSLSQQRSYAVLAYVLSLQGARDDLRWFVGHVSADGLSSAHPVLVNGKEDRALSQRVDFRVIDSPWDRLGASAGQMHTFASAQKRFASAAILRGKRLIAAGPYSIDAATIPGADPILLNMDAHPAIALNGQQELSITGWAIDGQARLPARGVYARVDGSRLLKASYGQVRDDVAAALQIPAANHVGFAVSIPAGDLISGEHQVDFLVVDASGKAYYITPKRLTLNVY